MISIALRSLFHERGKFIAALAGVAFATSLVLAQTGLFVGFRQMATAVISRVGGDVWVMSKGTKLLDFSDPLSAGIRSTVAAHNCVENARGLIFGWTSIRTPSGGSENCQVIGFEPNNRLGEMPWSLASGLPSDLHAPMRVAIDAGELRRFELPDSPVGRGIQIGGRDAYIAALTQGMRSFTVVPYVFAEAATAQRILGWGNDQMSYWALDLKNRACATDVISSIDRHPDLQAVTNDQFRKMTADYWVVGSGAGATLAFSALLGLVVGTFIVGQTLYSTTENHIRELATLKAIGASNMELVRFVAWQAGFLAVIGGAIGLLLAMTMRSGLAMIGLTMSLSASVLTVGTASVAFMCAVAGYVSMRKVLNVEASKVFV